MSKAQKAKSKHKGKGVFQDEIKDQDRTFVLFYATWCPFSIRFLPVFEEYSESNPKECLRVIVDDKADICEEYSIEYYPTVVLFKKGKVHKRLDARPGVGLSKKQFEELTENH